MELVLRHFFSPGVEGVRTTLFIWRERVRKVPLNAVVRSTFEQSPYKVVKATAIYSSDCSPLFIQAL